MTGATFALVLVRNLKYFPFPNSQSPIARSVWGISRCVLIVSVALTMSSISSSIAAQDLDVERDNKPQITVGKTGRLEVKKHVETSEVTSKPTPAPESVVVGPLEINRTKCSEWRAALLSTLTEGFPKEEKLAYVVANCSGDPSQLERFRALMKTFDVKVLEESNNGFVVDMDGKTASQIAAKRDVAGKSGDGVVDFVDWVKPRDKLSPSLNERLKNFVENHPSQADAVTPSQPQAAPAIEKMRLLTPEIQHMLDLMSQVSPSSGGSLGFPEFKLRASVPNAGIKVLPPHGEKDAPSSMADLIFYLYPGQQTQGVIDKINEVGGDVLGHSPAEAATPKVNARVSMRRLEDVAKVPEIKGVVPDSKVILHNDAATKERRPGHLPPY
jgi:hypothetical protein